MPNVGDTLTSFASFYILFAGVRYGVPKITLLRMAFNIGVDYVVGAIPFLGDAFDFVWKANQQNMNLIRTRLGARQRKDERLRICVRADLFTDRDPGGFDRCQRIDIDLGPDEPAVDLATEPRNSCILGRVAATVLNRPGIF